LSEGFSNKNSGDIAPDVPEIFPKLPAGEPRNRLTLAKWFFAPGQPLTARVAVNRYWEQLFGTGIVERWRISAASAKSRAIPNFWIGLLYTSRTTFIGSEEAVT